MSVVCTMKDRARNFEVRKIRRLLAATKETLARTADTTVTKRVDDLLDAGEDAPLPLSVIPDSMGINLCSVEDLTWTRQDDGQLVDLTIHFDTANKKPADQVVSFHKARAIVGESYTSLLDQIEQDLADTGKTIEQAHQNAPGGESKAILQGLYQDLFNTIHEFRGWIRKLRSPSMSTPKAASVRGRR